MQCLQFIGKAGTRNRDSHGRAGIVLQQGQRCRAHPSACSCFWRRALGPAAAKADWRVGEASQRTDSTIDEHRLVTAPSIHSRLLYCKSIAVERSARPNRRRHCTGKQTVHCRPLRSDFSEYPRMGYRRPHPASTLPLRPAEWPSAFPRRCKVRLRLPAFTMNCKHCNSDRIVARSVRGGVSVRQY